jgi:hypothetical protein
MIDGDEKVAHAPHCGIGEVRITFCLIVTMGHSLTELREPSPTGTRRGDNEYGVFSRECLATCDSGNLKPDRAPRSVPT